MSPEDVCSEQGCTGPIRQRSLCNRHYIRARRSGALDTSRKPEAERFWSHTRRVAGCLEWTGPTDLHGYGRFYSDGGKRVRSSRKAWELKNGPIPEGLVVRHKCDNPPCVEPEHLEIGTQADNVRDAVERERVKRGDSHPTRTNPESFPRGESRSWAKLTEDAGREIRRRAGEGETHRSLAAEYGVAFGLIGRVVRKETWKHVA